MQIKRSYAVTKIPLSQTSSPGGENQVMTRQILHLINFSKYTKSDNHFSKRFGQSITTKNNEMNEKLKQRVEWYCSEKVHGCNLSFIVDKLSHSNYRVEVANRSLVLSQSSVTFFPKTIEELQNKFGSGSVQLFKRIQDSLPQWIESDLGGELNAQDHSTLKTVQIYGELFGGSFPNKKPTDAKAIQKGIHYCPHHDFYAFDVLMSFESGKQVWALFDNVDCLLDECGFKVRAQILFKGSLEECLEFDVKFNSKLPETFYPDIITERQASWNDLDNICEGDVIKPTNCNIFVELSLKRRMKNSWKLMVCHSR